jgi:N-acyl-D-amino-acid deacylase
LPQSINEIIEIGRMARCPVHISHLIALGKRNWHLLGTTLDSVEKARKQGVDITFDTFPYTGGNTTAMTMCPPWAIDNGVDGLIEYLQNPPMRAKIENDINGTVPTWPHWETGYWSDNFVRNNGWDRLFAISISNQKNKPFEGLSFQEIADRQGKRPFDAYADLVVEERGQVMILLLDESGDDENEEWMRKILLHPYCSVMTDSILTGSGKPIPGAYGTFPRLLGRYVRDLKLIRLEEAIRKITSLSAQRFGIKDRGMLKEGNWADITIFDPDRIIDRATFENPFQYSEGIKYVLINGKIVVENDKFHSDILAGKVLRKFP